LEKRAESELTLKAIIIKSTLNSTEDIMKSHIWDIQQNLSLPDSIFSIVRRMVAMNRYVQGGSVSFVPNYYPTKGLLFEPYAQKTDSGVTTKQIGGANHDYREIEFFKKVVTTGESQWVDPYYDNEGAKDTVISYVMPVHDTSSKLAGVTCIDMALDTKSSITRLVKRHCPYKKQENHRNSNKVEESKGHFRYFYVILQIIIPKNLEKLRFR